MCILGSSHFISLGSLPDCPLPLSLLLFSCLPAAAWTHAGKLSLSTYSPVLFCITSLETSCIFFRHTIFGGDPYQIFGLFCPLLSSPVRKFTGKSVNVLINNLLCILVWFVNMRPLLETITVTPFAVLKVCNWTNDVTFSEQFQCQLFRLILLCGFI